MKDRTTRFFRRYWLAFAIVIFFMMMWVVLWNIRYSRVGITTVIIVPDLFGSPVSVLRMVGEDPVRGGAAPKIHDPPGVVRLSRTAARAGMVVMIPQLYYPFRENVLPEDVQGLVSAFGTKVEEIIAAHQRLRE